jgi:hypothetical protein
MFFIGLVLFGLMFAAIVGIQGYLAVWLWRTRRGTKQIPAGRVELP